MPPVATKSKYLVKKKAAKVTTNKQLNAKPNGETKKVETAIKSGLSQKVSQKIATQKVAPKTAQKASIQKAQKEKLAAQRSRIAAQREKAAARIAEAKANRASAGASVSASLQLAQTRAQIVVNKIPRTQQNNGSVRSSEGNYKNQGKNQGKDQGKDGDGDEYEEDEPVKGDPQIIDMAIAILQEIDPKQRMPKEKVIEILEELIEQTANLLEIEAIGYLLNQLENLEEKLEELEDYRSEQEHALRVAIYRLKDNEFADRITLDSDEKRDPDECHQIFTNAKEVYSSQSRYMKPTVKDQKLFREVNTLKKVDAKIKKKYRIS